jgi:hypothetical protein
MELVLTGHVWTTHMITIKLWTEFFELWEQRNNLVQKAKSNTYIHNKMKSLLHTDHACLCMTADLDKCMRTGRTNDLIN